MRWISFWNRGAEQLYGWNKDEALGHVAHELLRTIFPAPLEEIMRVAQHRPIGRGSSSIRNETEPWWVWRGWSLRQDERGRPVGILETNNDITERKRGAFGAEFLSFCFPARVGLRKIGGHRLEVEAVFRIGRNLEILSLNWSSKSHPSKPLPPWL